MKVCTASICMRNHAKLSILVLTTAFLLTVDCHYLCEADAVVTQLQGHNPRTPQTWTPLEATLPLS